MNAQPLMEEMEQRPFAYADIYRHPAMSGRDLPPALAAVRKNESSCVVILADGTWFVTWSQGSFEGAVDERIVCAKSTDLGRTWSEPVAITSSTPTVRRSYGCPFAVPGSERLYLFLHEGRRDGGHISHCGPDIDAGHFAHLWSDDQGATWSAITPIAIPDRDISAFPDKIHAHLNHPPQVMPGGQVVLPFTQGLRNGAVRRFWQLCCCETSLLWCENLLTEPDPAKLRFSLLPPGTRGMRVSIMSHGGNPAVRRLAAAFGGHHEEIASNAQELTVVPLADGRWLGVVRTYLGSPGYTISHDEGRTWTPVERLRYGPEGEFIEHPHTMCPIARLPDGRFLLLFTNNDGTRKGAAHVWDGGCRTRNPQWFAIAREVPGETRNAGLLFGPPRILAAADETPPADGFTASTATGISMPQYLHVDGRHFVQYGLKKEHILLDEIPAAVIDELTPDLPA